MYAVIFRAKLRHLDDEYGEMAAKLRALAFESYHCLDFTALTEGDNEIAISYWSSLEDIKRWRDDPLHAEAQKIGAQRWYEHYQVEVVEVARRYQSS
ncbi:antibiotic biosynthesis monooxygenase family protein [Neptunomonas marina]|uniref:Antibiotic biosynthesis monooxygenase n=1 Tax=Neptunomonas marina TaxID=1815562 RepID=A0A437QDA8_9GAMM|nr:antibiotic biosynthesis monooxygenase [Neptunomonas marina]RVU32526.1 antibiotic biosynthesis monooxygenase [Neptunomonas marina]